MGRIREQTTMAERPQHGGDHDQHDTGHGAHAGHGDHAAMFRDKFWISLLLAIPVVVYSEMVQHLLGYQPAPTAATPRTTQNTLIWPGPAPPALRKATMKVM